MSFRKFDVENIENNSNIYLLEELVKIKYGKNQKKVMDNQNGIYPIYGTGGLMGHSIEYLYNKPSVLIGRKGSISKVKYVEHPFWTVDTLFYTEIDESIVIPKYLYYKMSIIDFSFYNEGTTIPSLRTDTLNKIEFRIPPIKNQKEVVKILSALDNKIEINNKINKNLEEMAQAIFKQWFIDFEFPCIPENYKFLGASKPSIPENYKFSGASKPSVPENYKFSKESFEKVCTYKRVGGLPIPEDNCWFVYVLLCEDGSFYKGMTKDLYRRFYEHYTGVGAEWTKTHKPVKVIHYEKFNSQEEARKREVELKSGFGREWIKREYKKYKEGSITHKVAFMQNQQSSLESSGSPAHEVAFMLEHKSKLVPAGEMVESELGMIPKGWNVEAIKEFGDIITGKTPSTKKQEFYGNIYPFITIPDMHNRMYVTKTDRYLSQEGNRVQRNKLIPENSLIVSCIATVGLVSINLRESHTNQQINSIILNENILLEYLYFSLKDKSEYLNLLGSAGTTTKNVNKAVFENIKLIKPSKFLLGKYNRIVKEMFENIKFNSIENEKLSQLRDTLLPKLMSGELRVPIND